MKTTNLFWAMLLVIFSGCSNEEESSPVPNDFLKVAPETFVDLYSYPYVSNGDEISGVTAQSNAKILYEIIQESLPGAVQIDPNTGVITIKDATLFLPEEKAESLLIDITVKVSTGDISAINEQHFFIKSVNTCAGSESFLSQRMAAYFSTNDLPQTTMNKFEFTFTLNSDMNFCSLLYYPNFDYMQFKTFELLDETGEKIFSQELEFQPDGWGWGYYTMSDLSYSLKANQKYTLSCTAPNSFIELLLSTINDADITFPIDLGLMKITDARIFNELGLIETGFVPIYLGLEAK